MVNAQLRQTADAEGRKGLRGIVRRIMTLGEVYEHLLGVGMNGTIDFGAYAKALCANLPSLQPSAEGPVTLDCAAETLPVTLAAATALGIVLMELISNSYEHAFPGRGGSIVVRVLHGAALTEGVVTITDDGVGYVPQAETRRHGVGLARRLMQQVEGTLDVVGGRGTVWTLHFPVLVTAEAAAA